MANLLIAAVKYGKEAVDEYPFPPLNIAVKHGMVEYVNIFLNSDVNQVWEGKNVLTSALENGNPIVIGLILGTGRVLMESVRSEMTKACKNGDIMNIRYLFNYIDDYSVFFEKACENEHTDIVDFFLENLPASKKDQLKSGFIESCRRNRYLIVRRLINYGFPVELLIMREGISKCISNGHLETLKEFLPIADLDFVFETSPGTKCTPLSFAIRSDKETIFNFLVTYANVNFPDGDGRTALMEAVKSNNQKYTRYLINHTDLNHQDINGNTALSLAISYGKNTNGMMLVEDKKRINPQLRLERGRTYLMYAAEHIKVHNEFFRAIMSMSEDQVNLFDDRGRTALSIAFDNENALGINMLLNRTDLSIKYGKYTIFGTIFANIFVNWHTSLTTTMSILYDLVDKHPLTPLFIQEMQTIINGASNYVLQHNYNDFAILVARNNNGRWGLTLPDVKPKSPSKSYDNHNDYDDCSGYY